MIDQIIESFIKAGSVIYYIFLVSVYAWFLIIQKYFIVKKEIGESDNFVKNISDFLEKRQMSKLADYLKNEDTLIAKSLLKIMKFKNRWDIDSEVTGTRISYYRILDGNIGTIGTLSAIAPLLGLLGTVTGMMKTFSIIKLFGSANPALMSEGISEALLTTQAGLVVAFPIVLANTYLKNRVKEIKDNFEKIYIKMKGDRDV